MIKDIKNIEIIGINTDSTATISYQDERADDLNNGYAIISVPVNIRPIQLSAYRNMLVNQSVQSEHVCIVPYT